MLKKTFKNFAQFIAYSNLLIAFCASSLCLFTFLFFDFEQLVFETTCFVFFSTQFTYLFHRKVDHLYYGNRKITEQDKWAVRNFRSIEVFLIISFLFAFFFYWTLPKSITILLFPLLLISLFYIVRINLFGKLSNLRGIPFLKPFLIAFVWGGIASFLPIIINLGTESLLIANYHFYSLSMGLFVFGQAIPLDIRDSIIDKNANLKTIPHLFGMFGTKLTSAFCYSISSIILIGIYGNKHLFILSTAIAFFFSLFIIFKLKPNVNELQFSFIHESSLAFPLISLKILFLF
jgi:4-hydroxybenzoate polyprenyltransferase